MVTNYIYIKFIIVNTKPIFLIRNVYVTFIFFDYEDLINLVFKDFLVRHQASTLRINT